MATGIWSTELTPEETESLIEKVADQVVKRGLQTPAILFLDMHKPLANVGGNFALMSAPFAIPVLGYDFFNNYSRLFSKRENIEALLQRIEQLSKPQKAKDD